MAGFSLTDTDGMEKYLSRDEIPRVMAQADQMRPKPRAFFYTLFYTGARLNEALALRQKDIDIEKRRVAIKTLKLHKTYKGKKLKKPPKQEWRRVPVPAVYMQMMDLVFELRRGNPEARLWSITDRQAHNWIKTIMTKAGLPHHGPHTLRHTFGISAAMKNVPQAMIQKWLGHKKADTTSIYTTAGGSEEEELSDRMWSDA